MPKAKTAFVCQQCGSESPKWVGRCPNCGEWNSMVETVVSTARMGGGIEKELVTPQKLSQIKSLPQNRIKTGINEFDRVLGGGLVPGSLVLIAGEPGIGKSTLMLQLAASMETGPVAGSSRPTASPDIRRGPGARRDALRPRHPSSILYISGEESPQQIKIRAERLGIKSNNLLFLPETDVDNIIGAIREIREVGLIIIDSIQTLTTEDLAGMAGSVGQVRECTARLLKVAKSNHIPIFIIGHVTKEGAIAGPKVLEHMVDTVIYFEGEKFGSARVLRVTKNRFGATDEVGVFEMTDKGMMEITNPSRLFLRQRVKKVPGSAVVATIEGSRPLLAEIQALVVPTQLAIPRRLGQGLDYNRLQLITAIMTRRAGLPLSTFDVFVNVAGGLRIEEPAADLGVALAIYSAFKNIALDAKTVVFGELGLLGELREVSQAKQRIKEAKRLGFTNIISPEKYSSINQVIHTL